MLKLVKKLICFQEGSLQLPVLRPSTFMAIGSNGSLPLSEVSLHNCGPSLKVLSQTLPGLKAHLQEEFCADSTGMLLPVTEALAQRHVGLVVG